MTFKAEFYNLATLEAVDKFAAAGAGYGVRITFTVAPEYTFAGTPTLTVGAAGTATALTKTVDGYITPVTVA